MRRAVKPGFHADGGGLYLSVTERKGGDGVTRSWVVRYTSPDGRRREMGLGSYPEVGLGEARRAAAGKRQLARDGADPLVLRERARASAEAEAARTITFDECTKAYIAGQEAAWRNDKHAYQWRATLKSYVSPVFGALPVGEIDTGLVVRALDPLWTAKAETGRRVRGRIESVLDWAIARGLRDGPNPARWKGHLDKILPKRRPKPVEHHAALPFDQVGGFLRELGGASGSAARALEFTILTAARTNETIGARWREIDRAQGIWTVPGERMKGGREHRVPLSTAALRLLDDARGDAGDADVIFPNARRRVRRPLSNMAMLMALRRLGRADLTVHGFRSTFRDWAAERTRFPNHVVEAALAHVVADKVEAAYRRGDLFDKRRQLMQAWADFIDRQIAKGDGGVAAFSQQQGEDP